MQYSRLTLVRQSEGMSNLKHASSSNLLTTLKEQKDTIYEERDLSLQTIEDNLIALTQKRKQLVQFQSNHKNETSIDINILLKMIDQLEQRNKCYDICHYNLRIYSDILNRYKKDRNVVNKLIGKTANKNVIRESSLLQSFKKNMEEDDAYVTLKYSEESMLKQRSPPNQPLAEGWDSFRNNLKTTLFKSAKKPQTQKAQSLQDDYFTAIKNTLVEHIKQEKNYLISEYNESCKIHQQFENVLQKIIEQIACEKVERDEHIKQIQRENNEDLLQISSMISKLKMDEMSERFSFDQKIKQIQESIQQQLQEQKYVRRGEQKAMIRMMLQVVQFFN